MSVENDDTVQMPPVTDDTVRMSPIKASNLNHRELAESGARIPISPLASTDAAVIARELRTMTHALLALFEEFGVGDE